MRGFLLAVVAAIVLAGGPAAASTTVQATDPCGDARMTVVFDESTTQPTGTLSDSADLAAVELANVADGTVAVTTKLCGPAVAPVDLGPNYDVSWQVGHCGVTLTLRDVTSVTVERGVERWNSAALESTCSAERVELPWADAVTFAGNQFTVQLQAADLGAFAHILKPGTEWGALEARTLAAASADGGYGNVLGRVSFNASEGRDEAGPKWGFVVADPE